MANNIIVPVPTELKNIKSELIFGLTKRQVIGFGVTIAVVIPSFLLIKKVDLTLAMYSSFILGVPFIFATMFSKDNLYAEKWLKNILEHKVLFKEKRLFKVTAKNREVAIARGFIDEKKKKFSTNSTQDIGTKKE